VVRCVGAGQTMIKEDRGRDGKGQQTMRGTKINIV
jgi:hypothetical protein